MDLSALNLSGLALVPARDLGPEGLARLWAELGIEGLERQLFYDGGIASAQDFTAFALAPGRLSYAVRRGEDFVALFWLDRFSGQAAWIHFAVFRRARGPLARVIGRWVTAWLLTARKRSGGPLVRTLVGVTPDTHPLAVRFAQDIGFTVLGRVPGALPLAGGGAAGAVISTLTSEEVSAWVDRA